MTSQEQSTKLWVLASNAPYLLQTLKAITSLTTNDSTDHTQLSALCKTMAQIAVNKAESSTHEYTTPAGTINCRFCDNCMDHKGTFKDMHDENCVISKAHGAIKPPPTM